MTENLTFWVRFLNGECRRRDTRARWKAVSTPSVSAISDICPAGYLSAGQRRRLSLARMLAVPRPIWLLDEPTTALDAASQERLRGLMRTHLDERRHHLAATHGPLGLDGAQELRLGDQRLAGP